MRGFGVLLGLVGPLIAAGGVVAYFDQREGLGIGGMVVGACFLGIGVMLFLGDLLLRLTQRSASLMIRFELFRLKFMLQGELGSPEEEDVGFEEVSDRSGVRRWAAEP